MFLNLLRGQFMLFQFLPEILTADSQKVSCFSPLAIRRPQCRKNAGFLRYSQGCRKIQCSLLRLFPNRAGKIRWQVPRFNDRFGSQDTNPFNDILNISTDQKNLEIRILSLDGRILKRINLIDNNTAIDLSHLKAGIYIVYIENDQTNTFQKIIKR